MTLECLDDLASAQHMRAPKPNTVFRDARGAERRMLAQLDAILALGVELESRLVDGLPDLPDPDAFFSSAFVLGCIASARSRGVLEHALRVALDKDDATLAAVVDALCLASQPEIATLARALLDDAEPRLRAAALTVLDFRGEARDADVLPRLHDEAPLVQIAAARALRQPAIDPQLCVALPELFDHADPAVAAAALHAASYKRLGRGHARAVALCERGEFDSGRAALMLALGGDERDAARFGDWLAGSAHPALLRATGYYGLTDTLPRLVQSLTHEVPDSRAAAAEALTRITGARLLQTVEVPLYSEEDKPYVDDPEAKISVERVSEDAAAWSQWWSEHRKRFTAGMRYRAGEPLRALHPYRDLDSGPALHAQREIAQLELTILAGSKAVFLEVRDWVMRQSLALGQWEAWLGARAPQLERGFVRART